MSRPNRFGVIDADSIQMTCSERVVLYATVYGLRPRRCLEIGYCQGGSTAITAAALDDIGEGRLIYVDPQPAVAPEYWERLAHRVTHLIGRSPDVLTRATEEAGGPFDFVFVDGDHSQEGLIRDIEGLMPVLEDSALLLFHDAHHEPVGQGIGRMLAKYPGRLIDCGLLTTERIVDARPGVYWGGLRMLRHVRGAAVAAA